MTRKHFEAVAQAFRVNVLGDSRDEGAESVIDDLCVEFKRFNRAFDADKFKEACKKG